MDQEKIDGLRSRGYSVGDAEDFVGEVLTGPVRANFVINPVPIPQFVTIRVPPRPRGSGPLDLPQLELRELDPGVLSDLCDQFRRGVFEKAGKVDPRLKGK